MEKVLGRGLFFHLFFPLFYTIVIGIGIGLARLIFGFLLLLAFISAHSSHCYS